MNLTRRDALKHTALLGAAAAVPGVLARAAAGDGGVSLPPLPYAEDALVPAIDARTMRIHHGRHHAGYTRKYNDAMSGRAGASDVKDVLEHLRDLPADIRTSVRRNGGGYLNHDLFWKVMAPPGRGGGGGAPRGDLAARLTKDFGSVGAFKRVFSEAAGGVFGSGWAWLILRESDGRLAVVTTPNQDSPWMKGVVSPESVGTPLLGLDVWEHAYYLQYQNRRSDYIDNWWKVVNWQEVAQRLG